MDKLDKLSVLTKLFQNKKPCHKHHCKWTALDQSKGCPPPNFNTDNVRLVVILRRHNTSSGCVLYDSKLEQRPTSNEIPALKRKGLFKQGRCCNTPTTRQQREDVGVPCGRPRPRLASDTKMLEEVMFGSAPMVQKDSSLKVHSMQNPSQLMVTKVFVPATTNKGPSIEHDSFDLYSVQSMSADSAPKHIMLPEHPGPTSLAQSVPVDVPMPAKRHSDDTEDSGISASLASSCSSSFTTSGYSPSSSASFSSINSLTRRLLRNQTTSFEYSFAKRLSDEGGELLRSHQRPPCLGFGIIFTLPQEDTDTFRNFESFFFSHITLIESHVVKLKIAVEKVLHKKHMVTEALAIFRSAIFDLYTAPRLSEPVWLNMMCYTSHRVALYQNFLKEFISVLDRYDTKNTKFFVSTLITAVLTHHLAWVPTVSPAGATPSRTYLDKHSAKWLDAIAKSHPYNPLWAQLGDLYGAIGFPLRLSRTVIIGQKADLVCKLLHILSYFIRCSAVHERSVTRPTLDNIDGHIDIPGMRPIEEDQFLDGTDNGSAGKRYGSTTSCGTVQHASLQTSTDTVLSSRSEGTLIDTYMKSHKEILDNLSGDVTGLSSEHAAVREPDAVSQQSSQTNPSSPSLDHCNSCQLTGQPEGFYGNSVFYCCVDDVYGVRGKGGPHRCNFDICLEEESKTYDSKTGCGGGEAVSGQSALPTKHKPLLLFCVVDKEPRSASGDLCDTNLHEELPPSCSCLDSDCAITCKNQPQHTTKQETSKLTSLASPQTDKSNGLDQAKSEGSGSSKDLSNIQTQPDTVSEEEAGQLARCSLLGSEEIEGQVKVIRTRHVGRDDSVSVISKVKGINLKDGDGCDMNKAEPRKQDETTVTSISSSCHDLHLNQDGSTTMVQVIESSLQEANEVSELRQTPSEQSNINQLCSGSKVTSSDPCQSSTSGTVPHSSASCQVATGHSGLYPKLDDNAVDGCNPNGSTSVTRSYYPCHSGSMLPDDTLLSEPGGMEVIQADLGSLYPVIVDNTVISLANHSTDAHNGASVSNSSKPNPLTTSNTEANLSDQISGSNVESKSPVLGTSFDMSSVEAPLATMTAAKRQDGQADDKSIQPLVDQSMAHIKVKDWLRTNSESSALLCGNEHMPSPVQIESSPEKRPQEPLLMDEMEPPEKAHTTTTTTTPLSKKALMDRQDSTFDEYFVDGSVSLPDPEELENTVSTGGTCSRLCSRDDSENSVFLPNDNTACHQTQKASTSINQNMPDVLDVLDEYFKDDNGAVHLPKGPTKDLITDTLNFMQEIQEAQFMVEDDINMDDVLEGMVDSRSSETWASSSSKWQGVNRQQSNGSITSQQHGPSASTPARCRTVTPAELGRRRHGSATSNVSWELDAGEVNSNIKDVTMPRVLPEASDEELTSFEYNFGNSLLAGYTDHYMSDFVLHGTSDTYPSLLTKLQTDLSISLQNSVLDEPITEACCIVADTDKWMVRLHTCQCVAPDQMRQMDLSASQMVCNILESVTKLWKLKMSPEFCLMHLEDRLQEIYFRSKMLSEYIHVHKKIDLKELSTALGFDVSDMPLLLAVAGTHTPHLALALSK